MSIFGPLKTLVKRWRCNHEVYNSEEYATLVHNHTYRDERGYYHPHYEGVECTCRDCGKTWCENQEAYRYYTDKKEQLTEKVKKSP